MTCTREGRALYETFLAHARRQCAWRVSSRSHLLTGPAQSQSKIARMRSGSASGCGDGTAAASSAADTGSGVAPETSSKLVCAGPSAALVSRACVGGFASMRFRNALLVPIPARLYACAWTT